MEEGLGGVAPDCGGEGGVNQEVQAWDSQLLGKQEHVISSHQFPGCSPSLGGGCQRQVGQAGVLG